MVKLCAYCGKARPLTREHLWPDWVLRRTEYHHAYLAGAGKIVGREMKIRDVCAPCNNVRLGRLDEHVKSLWAPYLGQWIAAGQTIDFRYDHGQLLRWLLKVAYNTARSNVRNTDRHAKLLRRYAQVLIAEDAVTPVWAVAKVATIMPSFVFDEATQHFRPVQPQGARSGQIFIPGLSDERRFITRMVQLNGYLFSLFVLDDIDLEMETIQKVVASLPGTGLHSSGRTIIPPPETDTFSAMRGIERWPAPSR